MPLLDVADVLLDPLFSEQLTITRRLIATGANGRQTITSTVIRPKPFGVVTSASDDKLERGDAYQSRVNLIRVTTGFLLRSASVNYQPDLITWQGDDWIVIQIDNWSRYGAGFISALCSSVDGTDQPPSGPSNG